MECGLPRPTRFSSMRHTNSSIRTSESSQLILRAVRRVPLLLSSVRKRAAIAFRTAQEQWHTRRFKRDDALTLAACRFAHLRRFADAGHGRHRVRGAEYSKTGDECVGSILGG